ncbi:hypothetical protein, partial [Pseudophaeobacter profundi]|uniref:hypothetical protein n=1 Tax=Pseudophaeobacter profundi TaxID=3034152 RepID=UPI00242CD528
MSSRRFHRETKTASSEISSPFPSAFQTKFSDLELEKKKRDEYKVQEKELEAINAVFNIYDIYGEGNIDGSQVPDALRALGLNPTLGLVEKLTGSIKPGEQQITVEEFVP